MIPETFCKSANFPIGVCNLDQKLVKMTEQIDGQIHLNSTLPPVVSRLLSIVKVIPKF